MCLAPLPRLHSSGAAPPRTRLKGRARDPGQSQPSLGCTCTQARGARCLLWGYGGGKALLQPRRWLSPSLSVPLPLCPPPSRGSGKGGGHRCRGGAQLTARPAVLRVPRGQGPGPRLLCQGQRQLGFCPLSFGCPDATLAYCHQPRGREPGHCHRAWIRQPGFHGELLSRGCGSMPEGLRDCE